MFCGAFFMADDRFDIGAFRQNFDEDDDFERGPIIDVTPKKEEPESIQTDGHILDNQLINQKLDRSDRTQKEPTESLGGFVLAVIGLFLFVALLIVLIF
jgi:hypothetical protein